MNYLKYPFLKTNVYSTTEQVIGVWVNNKPIYKKTYLFNAPSSNTVRRVISISNLNWDTMIKCTGGLTNKNSGYMFFVQENFLQNENQCTIWVDNNYIAIQVNYTYFYNMPCHVTLEYTKTTDEPLISTTEILSAYLKDLPQSDLQEIASIAFKTLNESEIKEVS